MSIAGKPIYTAVLLEVTSVDQDCSRSSDNGLEEPLLGRGERASEESTRRGDGEGDLPRRMIRVLTFLGGMILGVCFSIMGFNELFHNYRDVSGKKVVLFSLAWSSLTSIAAYLFFGIFWSIVLYLKQESVHFTELSSDAFMVDVLEYHYALGVFLGFCLACTVTDVLHGMPWFSVLSTLAIALLWAKLMMWFASKNSARAESHLKPKGTSLPLMMV
jgi:hypothetical protein